MQGYIINFNRVKDEDLIVTILTNSNILTLYRFYGARHSHINLGYKLDFEVQSSIKSSIPQLRSVIHLAHHFNTQHHRMRIWQIFIKLFFLHLKDVDEIHSFYYDLLEKCSSIWHKQNPKRVAIEAYTELLEYEGRLHDEFVCFNCETNCKEDISLIRGFLPAHEKCVWSKPFKRAQIEHLFSNKSTLFLDDEEIERLWKILQEGF